MKSKKITSLFFLTVSPLMIFIALLNCSDVIVLGWLIEYRITDFVNGKIIHFYQLSNVL